MLACELRTTWRVLIGIWTADSPMVSQVAAYERGVVPREYSEARSKMI